MLSWVYAMIPIQYDICRMQLFNFDTNEDQNPDLPCKDKLAFDTERQARASANVVRYQHGSTVHAYRCRYCSLWHLASGPAD
jgi:hypothetical protein